MKKKKGPAWSLALTLLLFLGCAGGSVAPHRVVLYMLEYPSPEISGLMPLDTTIQVNRFTAVAPYNEGIIVYRDQSFQRQAYHYHRWRVPPPDMVSDFVARDLRTQKLYRAVLRYDSYARSRFRVEGDIVTFLEVDQPDAWYAVLEIDVVLGDQQSKNSSAWVVWQKSYRYREQCQAKGPKKLVEAMSRAVAAFSFDLSKDVHYGVMKRLKQPRP